MLVVRLPEAQVAGMLSDRLSVSAVNAPDLTVVAGPDEDIAALLTALRARDVDCRKVSVPVASHSWMVEPYLERASPSRSRTSGYPSRGSPSPPA